MKCCDLLQLQVKWLGESSQESNIIDSTALTLSTLFLTTLLRFELWVALPVWGNSIQKG